MKKRMVAAAIVALVVILSACSQREGVEVCADVCVKQGMIIRQYNKDEKTCSCEDR